MSEQWKIIEGYPDYAISDKGGVMSKKWGNWRLLSPMEDKKGYLSVNLCDRQKRKTSKIHRLVCQAFLPNPLNLPEVNHKNGVKDDNRLDNLEWVSSGDNQKHSWNTGLRIKKYGEDHHNHNKTVREFYHPDHGIVRATQAALVKDYNLRTQNVSNLIYGRQGSHKGWRLIE